MNFYSRFVKRGFDFLVAFCALVIGAPILLALSLLVAVKLGAPIIFRQKRAGFGGELFHLYKFRTMTDARDAHGDPLGDDERLVPFGRFLRSTSLDELPELFNVLKGEMSLVGPRPLLPQYLTRYTSEQMRRHEVRPGITGWAQVNGRNALSWEDRFKLDVWYVDHISLAIDVRILFMTIVKVVKREGISPEGMTTMPEFTEPTLKQP